MDIYEELGVKKIINAAGTYTIVGASRMSDKTLHDLNEAAHYNVMIQDLQKAVHKKVAELTHNEAAYLCNSCCVALYLSAAACVSRKYGKYLNDIPKEDIIKCNVVVPGGHLNPYARSIRQMGLDTKVVGPEHMRDAMTEDELVAGIDENTVAIYFITTTDDGYLGENCINLKDAIRIAHEHGLPIIVDAAAHTPPVSNLWHFSRDMGADIVCFSGGKDIRGPQASGLIVGKKEYLDIIEGIGFPIYSVGRMMKIGREEIIALYSAIKQYVEYDEQARIAWTERIVEKFNKDVAKTKYFHGERRWPNQAGQHLARIYLKIEHGCPISVDELQQRFKDYEPYGILAFGDSNGLFINPQMLEEWELDYIADAVNAIDSSL